MTTRFPLTSGAESFDDEDELDQSIDFARALEAHLVDSLVWRNDKPCAGPDQRACQVALTDEPTQVGEDVRTVLYAGNDATWLDAPVAMVVEGDEPETIALDSVPDLDGFEVDVEFHAEASARDVAAAAARDVAAPAERVSADRVEDAPSSASAPVEPADPFDGWLRALTGAAESASILVGLEAIRSFVSEGRAPRLAFPSTAAQALAEANIARLEGEELMATAAFLRVAAEWRRVLAGDGGDFSKCGSRTFDEWSADFLARTLGVPSKFELLKRELRRRGVAAFGLVENAA